MEDKKIRIDADASPFRDRLSEVKRDSREMANGIIEDALRISNSYKEVSKNIEDAIKQLERSQSVDVMQQKVDVGSRLSSGEISKEEVGDMLKAIMEGNNIAKLQTELTRDLIDSETRVGKEELDNDSKNIAELLSKKPHEERSLKERYQAAMLGLDGDRLSDDERRGGRLAGGMRGYGMAILGSKDPVSAGLNVASEAGGEMMAMGGKAGIIGAAVMLGAVAGKKMWDASAEYYKESLRSEVVTGSALDLDFAKGFSRYGVSAADFAARRTPLARTRLSGVGIDKAIESQIYFEKGMGIDQGMFGAAERLGVQSGGSGAGNIQLAVSALKNAGVIKGSDYSTVPEYLQIMIELGKDQVSKLGKVDQGLNTRVVGALSEISDGTRKSPEYLKSMVDAIKGGLSTAGSSQVEGLQYSVLSRIRPGASMVDLMKMRENPFGPGNEEYLPGMLEQYKKISGGGDRFTLMLKNAFPQLSSVQAAEDLAKAFEEGTLKDWSKKNLPAEGEPDIKGKAYTGTSGQAEAAAIMDNIAIKFADGLKVGFETVSGEIKEIERIMRTEVIRVKPVPPSEGYNPYIPPS